MIIPPNGDVIKQAVSAALLEDVGPGDISSLSTIPHDTRSHGQFRARQPGILCGMLVVDAVCWAVDTAIRLTPALRDGEAFDAGTVLAEVRGPAASILTMERTALNFLQRLSGVATLTAAYVAAVSDLPVRIVDTRKTTPGLRHLEKWAVRCGGAHNHRTGLYDAVMIKDNHIVAAGGIRQAVSRARAVIPHTMSIEVECDTLEQLAEAIEAGADSVLLDNMTPAMLRDAVALADRRVTLEASGGVNLQTVRAIAESGVQIISVGALTHSAPALDIGLDL